MAERNLMEVAKEIVAQELETFSLELLGVEEVRKQNSDGTIEMQTKLELEVPKGNGMFSRVRFACKTAQTRQFDRINFDEDEVLVSLTGLKVTFVDKGIMYLRCDAVQMI